MKGNRMILTAVFLSVVTLAPVSSWAFGGQWRGGPKAPPQAALDACTDKTEGTAVEFTNRRGATVQATCTLISGQMIAVPDTSQRLLRRLDRIADRLELTDSQREQVASIMRTHRAGSAALRQQLAEYRRQIREASLSASFDESAVRALTEKEAEAIASLSASRAVMINKIYAVLTPDQQASAEEYGLFVGPMSGRGRGFGGY
jgi:Spy/CpxP family protein refolding chaperone